MAQTTIISSIDRSNSYPESVLISAPSNCGTIMLTFVGTWTKQMVAELPTISIKMFTLDNEWLKDFNLDIDTSSIFTEDGIAHNATFQLYDIPQSFYLKITPIFDNEAIAAHNNTQENGVVSSIKTVNGIVTNDEADIWTTITNTFDIELIFDDTSIVPGGGGGSATLIEKTITANGEYNASDDSADGYSQVNVNVPNTYTAEDEGKVVDQGTLVAQTAMPSEVTENGTIDTTLYNSVNVNVPSGGGGSGAKKDVNFYDYDGTIVNSYTAAEFANLNAMPENPTHDGLTAQGWNWSLQDAKTYVASYGKLEIGQMYITSDGKTRIYIELTEGRLSPWLKLYLNANSELDIDWGDGSSHSTFTSTSADYKNEQHIYSNAGSYVISITVNTGGFVLQSSSDSLSTLLTNNDNSSNSPDRGYINSIKKIEVGSSVTSIGSYAFYNCSALSSVTIPSSVTSVGSSEFSGCSSLSSITIPSSVTSIGRSAFNTCYSLSSISIPNSVASIERNAFSGCSALYSITIPSSVTSVKSGAFYNCSSLSSITIPSSVTSVGDSTFYNCYSLSSVTVPGSVTNIIYNMFSNCSSLSSVTILNGVTSVGSSAFSGCSSLSSITIPSSVTSVGSSAFSNCYALSSITIPSSVTSIGSQAFSSCYSLATITIDKEEGSISGSPWGAITSAPTSTQIVWTG